MAIDIKNIKVEKQEKDSKSKKMGSSVLDILNKDIKLFNSSKINDKIKQGFYSDMAMLLTSGVDIKTTFELITTDINKEQIKNTFNSIKDKIIEGESLSDALEASGEFSAYEFYSVKIGEESGKLINVLNDLSEYFNNKIEQRRNIISAISYPIIVFIVAILAIYFMLNFIVPMFEDVFKRFDSDLPYLTQLVVNMSEGISKYSFPVFISVIGLISFMYISRKKVWYRSLMAEILLRIPKIGDMTRKIYLARFCLSMQLLISAKTPLINAIKLLKKMIGFYPLEISLTQIEKDILDGYTLNESMTNIKIYDKRMVSLLKVAEETNQLDMIFEKLKEQYSKDVEHQTSMIRSVIEPVMIIFIGIFVALILIAMYLPMFQMSTSVSF